MGGNTNSVGDHHIGGNINPFLKDGIKDGRLKAHKAMIAYDTGPVNNTAMGTGNVTAHINRVPLGSHIKALVHDTMKDYPILNICIRADEKRSPFIGTEGCAGANKNVETDDHIPDDADKGTNKGRRVDAGKISHGIKGSNGIGTNKVTI